MYDKCLDVNKYRDWLIAQAKGGAQYWYGAVYQRATASLLASKRKQYPAHYTSGRMAKYNRDISNGVFVGDCVNGAVKGAIWTDLGAHPIKYKSHGCPDTNADGMFDLCAKAGQHGGIDTLPNKPGILLHKNGHVGVTIGDGKAVEFRGFAYGCVITNVKDRGWKDWAMLPWVDYAQQSVAPVDKPVDKGDKPVDKPKTYKTTGNVWARTEPIVRDETRLYVIKRDTVVDVVKPCDGWTMIRTNDGKLAYVSNKYLKEE